LSLAAVLLAVTVAGLLRLHIDTGPDAFLPAGDPSVLDMDQTARQFGGDSIVVLLQTARPAALLGPDQLPTLVELEGRLARLPDVATVFGPATSINQIAGASQNLIARIAGERDGLMAAAEQKARAAGADDPHIQQARQQAVAAFDIRYGGLLARGLPAGLPTLHNPHFVRTLVFDADGDPRPQWRYLVPTSTTIVISVRPREDIDQAATERLVQAVHHTVTDAALPTTVVTISGAPALAAALGQQVRTELPHLGLLALALIAGCYLLIPWTRRRRDRLVPLPSTLAATAVVLAGFGWLGHPLSLGVIAFLPILIGTGSDFPAYLAHGTHPRRVLIAATASAAGFAALGLSPLPFVRDLGLALAAGLLIALAIATATLHLTRGLTRGARTPERAQPERTPPPAPTPPRPPNRRLALLTGLSILAIGGWALLPQLNLQAQPDRLAEGLPATTDAQHIEQVVGSSGEIQLVLRGPNVLTPAALGWMRAAEDAAIINYGDQVHPIASPPDLLDFLGQSPTQEQINAAITTLPPYLSGAVVSFDYHAAVIRFGIRLQDLGDQQRLLTGLTHSLPAPPPGYQTQTVGLPVAAARAYQLLSHDRYLSNTLGIVLAGLVMLLGLGTTGYLVPKAVLAALLATGWGLAATWLLGLSLTPLTIALGSLSTATACEFTLLLSAARDHSTPHRTVNVAALAASLGYLALTASHLAVLRDFGLLLAATVVLSLLASHLVVNATPPGPGRADHAHTTPHPPRTQHRIHDLVTTVTRARRRPAQCSPDRSFS
jgi:hypothetical protein